MKNTIRNLKVRAIITLFKLSAKIFTKNRGICDGHCVNCELMMRINADGFNTNLCDVLYGFED